MSAVVINGGLVHYEAFGRGRPILFIHGWLGSWRYWMATMESLAVEYRVYALDLWGFGDSDKAERRFNMKDYVNLVEVFVEELGLEDPLLVGHSLGAIIAILYACRHHASVPKIMAVSLPLSPEVVDRRITNYSQSSMLSKVFRWKPIPDKEIEEEASRAAENVIDLSLKSFEKDSASLQLDNAKDSDILVVFGERDDVIDPTPVKELNGTHDHVKHISLSSSRHFPMIDESGKFNRLLKDFADQNATLESLTLKEEWRRRTR